MFVTKKYFEKWVAENIGAKEKEYHSMWASLFGGLFANKTLREHVKINREEIQELQKQVLLLTKKLGLEYKTVAEKTDYFKSKKK